MVEAFQRNRHRHSRIPLRSLRNCCCCIYLHYSGTFKHFLHDNDTNNILKCRFPINIILCILFQFQVLIIPIVLPIASLRTCISRQCCVPRYKQPIGELVMTTMICIIYLGTVVGVILPRLDTLINEKEDFVSSHLIFKVWTLNTVNRPWNKNVL